MESANLNHHQHQLQDHLSGSSSSSSSSFSSSFAATSCYGVATTPSWTPIPNIPSNSVEFIQNYNGVILNSRQKNEFLAVSPPNSCMIGREWSTSDEASFNSQSTRDDDLSLAKIKDELSSDSFPKFTEMLNGSAASSVGDSHHHHHHLPPASYLKNEPKDLNDLSEKLLLQTLSPGFPMFSSAGEFYSSRPQTCPSSGGSRSGTFSQIYPSINISNLNQSASAIPSSFDMNLQALDLLTCSRFSGGSCFSQQPSQENNIGFRHDVMQQSNQRQPYSPNKISPIPSEITEAKRSPSSLPEPKATQAAAKKSRVEPRASCPPFKVRKEKLGDRIAALQQLVAPFGKTDTASVLMEAIGYIKFLQNQVETLSVPYMKSSRNKTPCRSKQGGSTGEQDGISEEPKRDLRSRGLCLVPLSCMSYVTSDSGGGIWPPPSFGGRT